MALSMACLAYEAGEIGGDIGRPVATVLGRFAGGPKKPSSIEALPAYQSALEKGGPYELLGAASKR